ncbi:hypothetical protein N8368_03125 [Bacteroidia bacterium]|nr:hypothetical protein [Bacteroidia bacterium]
MNITLKTILVGLLVVIAGLFLGSLLNMGIIMIGPSVIPMPKGVKPMDEDSLEEFMHLFETKHFVMPFLAHALGTLVGAFVAVKLSNIFNVPEVGLIASIAIGLLFLWGGIETSKSIGASMNATLFDAVLAYIPFTLGGYFLAKRKA